MSKITAPPVDDVEVADLAAGGMRLSAIAARYEITPDQARGAIARGRLEKAALNRSQLQLPTRRPIAPAEPPLPLDQLAPDSIELEDMPPEPPAAPAAAPPRLRPAVDPLEIEELISWARAQGAPRARALADRIETCRTELRTLYQRHSETADARAAVDDALKQLADAKATLKAIERGEAAPVPAPRKAPAAPADLDLSYSAEVRAWARENGHQVPDIGRLRGTVVAAYRDAHQSVAGVPTGPEPPEADREHP
jgi:hypothetical protein